MPYATVVVELDEGPRIVGAARHPDPAAIRIGQRVRVVPEPRTDDFSFLTVQFDGSLPFLRTRPLPGRRPMPETRCPTFRSWSRWAGAWPRSRSTARPR